MSESENTNSQNATADVSVSTTSKSTNGENTNDDPVPTSQLENDANNSKVDVNEEDILKETKLTLSTCIDSEDKINSFNISKGCENNVLEHGKDDQTKNEPKRSEIEESDISKGNNIDGKSKSECHNEEKNGDYHNKKSIKENRPKESIEKRERKRKRKRSRERSSEPFSKTRNRSRSRSLSAPVENEKMYEDRKQSKNTTSTKTSRNEHPDLSMTARQRRTVDLLTSRTGGAYIPPAKLRLLQAEITDKSSAAYQRIAWEALKKSIHGYINKVNVDNIGIITRELLKENIIRGRGLLCRSIIQAQAASPTFTHVYAALVAIINSKFPNIGELLLKRLVLHFKRGFRRNDKTICLSSARFIAHLVNQRVAHEILALEILTLLVENPTDDSVEVAIAFLRECGMKLTEVSSKGISAIFDMLKNILHEGKLDKRVQYMIEVVFQVRKDGFKDHQSVIESLELVEEDDQFTHLISLDEAAETQDNLNVFKFDEKYQENENKYSGLSKELLGSEAEDGDSGSESDTEDSDNDKEDDENKKSDVIIDNTETNLVALRRTIYLTIHSSLDYEECAHKLMKMELKSGQEPELCHMFLDCCAEQRTYEKFYGLLAQRFCAINKIYIESFEEIFKATYSTTHRLDTNRLRNVSKFFAHLLYTNAIGWDVLECIHLNELETTSSSRIFIKILFQELAEYMGLSFLNAKLKDPELAEAFSGLFPRDNPKNTRFAINFFTSIGLGGLTDDLRQFLKSSPKIIPNVVMEQESTKADNSSSSSSTSSTSSSSDSESSSSSSSSEVERKTSSKSKYSAKKKNKNKPKTIVNKKENKSSSKHSKNKRKRNSKSSNSEKEDSSSSSSDSESSTCSSTSSEDYKKKKSNKKSEKAKENVHKVSERSKQNPFRSSERTDNYAEHRPKSRKRERKLSEDSNKDKHDTYKTTSSTNKTKISENTGSTFTASENSKTNKEKKKLSENSSQKKNDRKYSYEKNDESHNDRSRENYKRDRNNENRNRAYDKHEKYKDSRDKEKTDKTAYKEKTTDERHTDYKREKESHRDYETKRRKM